MTGVGEQCRGVRNQAIDRLQDDDADIEGRTNGKGATEALWYMVMSMPMTMMVTMIMIMIMVMIVIVMVMVMVMVMVVIMAVCGIQGHGMLTKTW
jgi:ABC-type multidrug transport system permease subunit